uniref:Uncharacterized protein n=1 Tax=Panagrolaimus davidi TaxID=227884 RepID=A0A914QH21_9BILA
MLFPPTSSTPDDLQQHSSQQVQVLPSDSPSTLRITRKRPHSASLRQTQSQIQPLVELESPPSSPHQVSKDPSIVIIICIVNLFIVVSLLLYKYVICYFNVCILWGRITY